MKTEFVFKCGHVVKAQQGETLWYPLGYSILPGSQIADLICPDCAVLVVRQKQAKLDYIAAKMRGETVAPRAISVEKGFSDSVRLLPDDKKFLADCGIAWNSSTNNN